MIKFSKKSLSLNRRCVHSDLHQNCITQSINHVKPQLDDGSLSSVHLMEDCIQRMNDMKILNSFASKVDDDLLLASASNFDLEDNLGIF
jgi:hypothetical protein